MFIYAFGNLEIYYSQNNLKCNNKNKKYLINIYNKIQVIYIIFLIINYTNQIIMYIKN